MEDGREDARLQNLWNFVLEKYESATDEKLQHHSVLTVEDMEARLSDMARAGRGEIIKKSAETVFNVAKYASAVSPVSSHASIVFEALTAIKTTVEDYQKNFTKKRVLEKVHEAARNLDRIQDYMKMSHDGLEIDAALKTSIQQLFTQILMLCMIYQKVERDSRTRLGRAKSLLKAAIGYDGGIGSNLKKIQDETARELSNNVAALRVSDAYAKSDRNLKNLREYLEIGDATPLWESIQTSLRQAHVENTGEWFRRLPEFTSWADADSTCQTPTLVLRAKIGCGKRHLCSQVVQFLEDKYISQHRNVNTSIAWYFFPRDEDLKSDSNLNDEESIDMQSEGIKKDASLRDALVALAWQLAKRDGAFEQHAIGQMRARPRGFSKALDVWTELIFRFFKDKNEDTKPTKISFLVIDGFVPANADSYEKKTLKRMINDTSDSAQKSFQIRLLLSGELEKFKADKMKEINIFDEGQRLDAELLIENRLKRTYEPWNKEMEGYRILREMEKRVFSDFNGNYHDLNESLDEIDRTSKKGLFDLRELQLRGLGLATTAERHLEMLNDELNDEEVELLNEVISFLICKKDPPTIQQLKAYVSLRLGSKAEKLVEAQISRKYPPRLITVLPDNRLHSPGLEKLFEKEETKDIISNRGDKQIGNRRQALQDSVAIPRQVLESICAQSALNHSMIDTLKRYLEGDAAERPRIRFNRLQSEINVILSLLQAVCSHEHREREDSKSFHRYIATRLPRHFVDIKPHQLADIPEPTRKKIGRYLYQFFMDEQTVEIWMPKGIVKQLASKKWSDRNWEDHMKFAATWLKDDTIRSNFKENPRTEPGDSKNREAVEQESNKGIYSVLPSWASLFSRSDIDEEAMFRKLLQIPIKVIASQWLQGYNWNALDALQIFMRVWVKASNGTCTPPEAQNADHKCETCTPCKSQNTSHECKIRTCSDLIEGWEERAMDLLRTTKMQARRNPTQDVRLAETFLALGHYDKAGTRCEFAQSREHQNIKAILCLSHVRERTNRKKKALEELLEIRYTIQSAKFRFHSPNEWKKELDRFWRLCDETRNAEAAIRACRFLSKEFPEEQIAFDKASEWVDKSGTLSGTIDILSAPLRQTSRRCSLLTRLLLSNAKSPRFHRKFYLELKENQEQLRKGYEEAIAASVDRLEKGYLHYYYGEFLFYQQRSTNVALSEMPTTAADQYEQCIMAVETTPRESHNLETMLRLYSMAAERLALVYVEAVKMGELKNIHEYIDRLVKHKRWVDKTHPYEVNYVALQLGRLYFVSGNREKARSSVKKHVEQAFDLLKSRNEGDDWKGYSMLAEALIPLKDDNNAKAAWSLIFNDPDKHLKSDLSITCSGGCGWTWVDWNQGRDVHICRDCPRVRFENGCHDLLKKNKLEDRVCGQSHSFLTIPKRKKREVNRIENGLVLVGQTDMKIEKWLAKVRHNYGIPNPDLQWCERTVDSLLRGKQKTQRKLNAASTVIGA